ncbi:MAG: hypothetical protein QNL85_02880 [Euryarchaeota archaeon]
MLEVEQLNPSTWQEFLEAPAALLVLGKTDCQPCKAWIKTLTSQPDDVLNVRQVRVGTLLLDAPGFGQFKMTHPWVALVDVLPFNALYINGERGAEWAGASIERLLKELNGRA